MMNSNHDKLVFSYNWNNKLAGKYFTSLRIRNDQRFVQFKSYEICIRKKKQDIFFCYATLINFAYYRLDQINDFVAGIDTGYSMTECREMIKTMYKNQKIDWEKQQLVFCLFRKNDKTPSKPINQLEMEEVDV
jgi:uncharacterized protein YqfB (UPF0267 family)